MCHIHHEIRTHPIRNRAEASKINLPWIRRTTRDNQLGAMLQRQAFHLFIINQGIISPNAILHSIKPFSRHIGSCPMRQMPTRRKRHPQKCIIGLQKCEENTLICLRPRIGLNIGEFATEKLAGPINCQLLHLIHKFAATIIAFIGITFGIFIG